MRTDHRSAYRQRPKGMAGRRCPACGSVLVPLAAKVSNGAVVLPLRLISLRLGRYESYVYHCASCQRNWVFRRWASTAGGPVDSHETEEVEDVRSLWWVSLDHERICPDPGCRVWLSQELLGLLMVSAL